MSMIWTILGFSVGILAILCVTLAEFVVEREFFQQWRFHLGGAVVLSGAITWLVGKGLARTRRRAASDQPDSGEESESDKALYLTDPRYWGILLMALGVLMPFVLPLHAYKTVKRAVSPPPRRTNVVQVAERPAPSRRALELAPVRLQGIIYREAQPAAIINGQTFFVGNRIGDAVVSSITREGITLRLGEETKMFYLSTERPEIFSQ